MAKRETIYTVCAESNTVLRASRDYLNALNFAAALDAGSYYICTSEFSCLKKGDVMTDVVDLL